MEWLKDWSSTLFFKIFAGFCIGYDIGHASKISSKIVLLNFHVFNYMRIGFGIHLNWKIIVCASVSWLRSACFNLEEIKIIFTKNCKFDLCSSTDTHCSVCTPNTSAVDAHSWVSAKTMMIHLIRKLCTP